MRCLRHHREALWGTCNCRDCVTFPKQQVAAELTPLLQGCMFVQIKRIRNIQAPK